MELPGRRRTDDEGRHRETGSSRRTAVVNSATAARDEATTGAGWPSRISTRRLDDTAGGRTPRHDLAGRVAGQLRRGHRAPAGRRYSGGLVSGGKRQPRQPPQRHQAARLQRHQDQEPPRLDSSQPRPGAEDGQQARRDDVQADPGQRRTDSASTPPSYERSRRRHPCTVSATQARPTRFASVATTSMSMKTIRIDQNGRRHEREPAEGYDPAKPMPAEAAHT